MSIEGDAAGQAKTHGPSFNCCAEMMKMMGQCGCKNEEKIDFDKFFGKMTDFCRDMMKNAKETKKE